MTKRATKRPEGFEKPAHWNNSPPPKPQPLDETAEHGDGDHAAEEANEGGKTVSPTRYGDWTKKGIAIDF